VVASPLLSLSQIALSLVEVAMVLMIVLASLVLMTPLLQLLWWLVELLTVVVYFFAGQMVVWNPTDSVVLMSEVVLWSME
jgi:hypothetical protein